jgi:transcriptional regulator with XRE-family HTH domain
MVTDIEALGQFLSNARKLTDKSRSEISNEVGVREHTVLHWETAFSFPSQNLLPFIAKAYNVKLDVLITVWQLATVAREEEKTARRSNHGRVSSGRLPTTPLSVSNER